jgi:multiple sugar transport system permease protein
MKTRQIVKPFFIYFAVLLLLIWTVAPLLWMFISSISPTKSLLSTSGSLLPSQPTFERYSAILFGGKINFNGTNISASAEVFKRSLLNSLIVTSITTVLCLIFGGIAAYAFARLKFMLKKQVLFLAMFLQLLPPVALVVPFYFMVRVTGMIDQIATLVVIYISFVLVYVIWVLNGYFKTIPSDLEAAARIDGCTRLGAFVKVLLPSAVPGFVAVGTLAFLMCWDEFMYALVFTNSLNSKTMPVAISEFSTQFGIDYGMMMTGGVLATVIPLILALIFQKYIVSGLTAGAVKG